MLYVPMYTQSRLQAIWATTPAMIGLAKGTQCVHRECYFPVWSCSLENSRQTEFCKVYGKIRYMMEKHAPMCCKPNMHELIDNTILLCTGSRATLSFRGVTVYNNSLIDINAIGGNTDQETLLCHTDNTNCCGTQQSIDGRVLGEWYYPDGIPVDNIRANQTDNHYFSASRSQSVIRLFHMVLVHPLKGCFCCELPDRHGSNQILCVNIGKKKYVISTI